MAINSFLMELDGRWVLWELGQDTLAFCALEDVGEIAAPGAERYDGENWYRGTPPFEAPGAPATARESSRSKKAIGQRPTETGSEGAVLGSAGGVPGSEGAVLGSEGAEPGSEGGARWVSMQYAFPRERLVGLLRALSAWHGAQIRNEGASKLGSCSSVINRVVELKFIGGPGAALCGTNANSPVVCANVLWRLRPHEMTTLISFEDCMRGLGGCPHLGKRHAPLEIGEIEDEIDRELGEPREAHASHGGTFERRMKRFAALVAQIDPNGRLGGLGALRQQPPHQSEQIDEQGRTGE